MPGEGKLVVTARAALLAAVVMELVLYRLATRVGIFIPKSGAMTRGFLWLSGLGRISFNLAFLLALWGICLELAGFTRRWKSASLLEAGAYGSLAVSLGLVAVSYAGLNVSPWAYLVVLVAVYSCFTALAWKGALPGERTVLALLLLAQVFSRYFALAQSSPLPYQLEAHRAAETLAVAVPLALGYCLVLNQRFLRTKGPLLSGLAAGMASMLAYSVKPHLGGILAMWAMGFSLYFPWLFYSLSFGTAVCAITILLRDELFRPRAYGYAFILLAGIIVQTDYQHLLLLLGYALLNCQIVLVARTVEG